MKETYNKMSIENVRKHICNISILVVYRLLLEYIYIGYIVPEFSYFGFSYDFILEKYLISWCVYIFEALIAFKNSNNVSFSNLTISLIYLLAFVPSCIMMGLCDTPFLTEITLFWTLLFLFNGFSFIRKYKLKAIFVLNIKTIEKIAVLLVLINFFIWGYYAKFHIQLSLIDVYDLRMEARQYNMPIILSYILLVSKTCIPFLSVWSYSINNKKIACLLLLSQIISFFTNGSKYTLLGIVVAYILYYILKTVGERHIFLKLFLLIPLTGVIESLMFKSHYVYDIIIRRVLFIPSYLNYCYFDFFSQNQIDWFRESLFSKIGYSSPYIERIAYMIGRVYFGKIDGSANNGLFSDFYANCGFLGVFIGPVLIILTLKFLNHCSENIPIEVMASSILSVSIILISSSFFTAWVTHGILFLALFMYFIPKRSLMQNNNNSSIR